jgi:hypothetical protein
MRGLIRSIRPSSPVAESTVARRSVARRWGAAVLAAPGFEALADGDGGDDEADGRIGPGPAERGVEDQADEKNGGKVGAQQGLGGVGHDGGRGQGPASPPLGPRKATA